MSHTSEAVRGQNVINSKNTFYSRSRENKKRKHQKKQKFRGLTTMYTKREKREATVETGRESSASSEQFFSSSSSSDSDNSRFRTMKRNGEIRQRFKREALPAEPKSNEILIEKPHAQDPQLQKSMGIILQNLAKQIRPKDRQYSSDLIQNKEFPKQYFPFKEEEKIDVKYLNSPFVAPSLRKRCFVNESSQITPKFEEYQLPFQQLPLRKVDQALKSSHHSFQSLQNKSEENISNEGEVQIVELNHKKKDKQLRLLSWIEKSQREKGTLPSETFESNGRLPIFFRRNLEEFLGTFDGVSP